MKLRNKKTGEIVRVEFLNNWQTDDGTEIGFRECNTRVVYSYDSLTELNADWEDYEEPKDVWWLDNEGNVNHVSRIDDYCFKKNIQIGNYFETEEEAEKAVEKLKAWKRLKDYNVKFNLDFVRNKIDFTYSVNNPLLSVLDGEEQIFNNMKIIFGGKNE